MNFRGPDKEESLQDEERDIYLCQRPNKTNYILNKMRIFQLFSHNQPYLKMI